MLKANKAMFFIIVAAAMFVLFGICPAIDVFGKKSFNGFYTLFNATGLGFPRFLAFLMLVSPLIVLIRQIADFKVSEKVNGMLETICFAASVFLFIIFAVTLPEGVRAATGAYLYLAFGVVGLIGAYLVGKK